MSLILGGIPDGAEEDDIREFFNDIEISEIQIDGSSARITLNDPSKVEQALALNGQSIAGSPISIIEHSDEKTEEVGEESPKRQREPEEEDENPPKQARVEEGTEETAQEEDEAQPAENTNDTNQNDSTTAMETNNDNDDLEFQEDGEAHNLKRVTRQSKLEKEKEKDKEKSKDKDKHKNKDKEKHKDKDKQKEKNKDKDKQKNKDKTKDKDKNKESNPESEKKSNRKKKSTEVETTQEDNDADDLNYDLSYEAVEENFPVAHSNSNSNVNSTRLVKKERSGGAVAKRQFDSTPPELLRETPPQEQKLRIENRKIPIDLQELAEFKESMVKLKKDENWEELKGILKALVSREPTLQDLQFTRLGITVAELCKVPQVEIYADIVLRQWKALAAKQGLKPRTNQSITVTAPVTMPRITSHEKINSPSLNIVTSQPSVASTPTTPVTPSPSPKEVERSFASSEEQPSQPEETPASQPTQDQSQPLEPLSPTVLSDFGRQLSFGVYDSQPRNAMIKRLCQALMTPDENGACEHDKPGVGNPKDIAVQIENVIYKNYEGQTDKARTKFNQLYTNLTHKPNSSLRYNVLSGSITPSRLVQMKADELGSEEMAKRRQESKEYGKSAAMADWGKPEVTTDQFRCSKCGERKCTYFQMQTRSADEPLTTFVTCVNCNNAWKF